MTDEHESYPDTHHDPYSKTVFGFWLYLLTDFMLFATLFATYAVLKNNTFGGPSTQELYHLPIELTETLILLTCSLTSGIGLVFAHRKNRNLAILFFGITALLGILFFAIEIYDFNTFLSKGHRWDGSAFLSSYFSLIGTFGVHVVLAILWTIFLIPLAYRDGITSRTLQRLTCLKMFWQFLSIVWLFIFTLVYLLGGKLA